MFNNLGFTWFKEERAYAAAMTARSVPVALEHLVRELTFSEHGQLHSSAFHCPGASGRHMSSIRYIISTVSFSGI